MFQKLTTRLLSPPLFDVFLTFQRETKLMFKCVKNSIFIEDLVS